MFTISRVIVSTLKRGGDNCGNKVGASGSKVSSAGVLV